MNTETAAKTVGDVTLRVNDLQAMKQFYQEVLGFELLGNLPSVVLLRPADNRSGQIRMFALLQRSVGGSSEPGAVRHITFLLPVPDPELERRRLEGLGLRVDTTGQQTAGQCALLFRDPEGNEVELLCLDPTTDRQVNSAPAEAATWSARSIRPHRNLPMQEAKHDSNEY